MGGGGGSLRGIYDNMTPGLDMFSCLPFSEEDGGRWTEGEERWLVTFTRNIYM